MPIQIVRIVLGLEMSPATADFILRNAPQVALSVSLNIIKDGQGMDEHVEANAKIWKEWEPIISEVWKAMHEELYCKLHKIENPSEFYPIQKGEP